MGVVLLTVLGGTLGTLAIATDTLGAGERWEAIVARVDRYLAGPVPDRETRGTVLVTEPTPTLIPSLEPGAVPTLTPTSTPAPARAPVDFDMATTADGETVAVVSRETEFFRSSDGGATWPGP